MHTLTITGASDDLIDFEGDIYDEIDYFIDDDELILGISDGTLLTVTYDDGGIWRFKPIHIGEGTQYSKVDGVAAEETNDVVTLVSERKFKWATVAPSWKTVKG